MARKDVSTTTVSTDLTAGSLFNLQGKVALVTGAATGIGKMIAISYVQNGAKVYIASRSLPALEELANSLGGPSKCVAIKADLESKAGCDKLADDIKKREGKLDILVNNSGMSWGAPMDDFPEKNGWDRVMALNVKSTYYLTVALLPLLVKDATALDPAHVINISSIAGIIADAEDGLSAEGTGTFSYAASKAALSHLTRVLALSLAPKHVCVNAIAPGVFPSRMTSFSFQKLSNSETAPTSGVGGFPPTGRFGDSQDMAGLAIFLGSKASAHCTGSVIPLDGGTSLGQGGVSARL